MNNQPLRFTNFLAFNVNATYEAICAVIERELNIPTTFSEGQSFDQFFHDEVDVGYICGLPYSKLVRLENAPFELLVAPVFNEARAAGQPVYFSDVIVPHDSPFQTFDDLAGCTFTYNESVSYSGYHVMAWHLAQQGRDWHFFGKRVKSGAHVNSIDAIANARADAAAVDSQTLSAALRLDPMLADRVRVIDVIGPSPHPPVVVGRGVSAELKAQLRDIYLNLHLDPDLQPILHAGSIERFVEVDDAYYDTIRERVDSSEIMFSSMGG